ncbi:MAG: SDR family NAD(P)-dependent oxidoreductase [Pirellulales bacterium]
MSAPTADSHNTSSNHPGMAVVTGASSGIGEVYAQRLAERGHDLLLVARRHDRLAALQKQLSDQHGTRVEIVRTDLSLSEQITQLAGRIAKLPTLSMLVNNAGFGTLGNFVDVRLERHRAMLQVHVMAIAELTYAALPVMLANRRGHIINVSSMSAYLVGPGQVTYAASKSFVKSFSESLQAELRGTGVDVQALCPGMTRTGFHDTSDFVGFDRSQMPRGLWMDSEGVVAASLRRLGGRRAVCVPGIRNKILAGLFGFGPIRALTGSVVRKK